MNEKFILETIVVDSSPDQLTWEAIEDLGGRLNLRCLTLAQQTHPGKARALAIQEARNEIILSLDSDMELPDATVWQMVGYLQNHPTVARMTGQSLFLSGAEAGQVDCPGSHDRMHKQGDTIYSEGVYGRFEAFYRSTFLELGGYDPLFVPLGEGTELSVRYWRAGYPLGCDTGIIAYHNAGAPHSLSREHADRVGGRLQTLLLLACKYNVCEAAEIPHLGEVYKVWLEANNLSPSDLVVHAAQVAQWFARHYDEFKALQANAPSRFDFKPFDIFSARELLAECLAQAQARNRPCYEKAVMAKGEAGQPSPQPLTETKQPGL